MVTVVEINISKEKNFTMQIPTELQAGTRNIFWRGDINATFEYINNKKLHNYSPNLVKTINAFKLHDISKAKCGNAPGYTFCHHGVSRIDCAFKDQTLLEKVKGIEVISTCFSDHCALKIKLCLPAEKFWRPSYLWMLNS